MGISWQSMELVYGFNQLEDGFVWSTFAFGIEFAATGAVVVLPVFYPHEDGVLYAYNGSAGGGRRFGLRRGMNRVALACPAGDTKYDFQVKPHRALLEDARDLGVRVHAPERAGGDAADEGAACDWLPPKRSADLVGALAGHVLESFVGEGLFFNCIQPAGDVPYLYVAVYLPRAERNRAGFLAPVCINGEVFPLEVELGSDALPNILPHLREVRYAGRMSLAPFLDASGELVDLDISYGDPAAPAGFAGQSTHWRGRGFGPMPAAENIVRVAGPVGEMYFLFAGASWFVKLARLYEELSGQSFEACGPMLDWGIGCGRIARFFPERMRGQLHGVDIDDLNIEWCRQNLPGIDVRVTRPDPPLPFGDGMFALVFGHSVMTHLGEESQLAWLAELARVTRPGGYCLLTVLGELSWFLRFYPAGRTPERIVDLLETGFVDDGALDVGVDAAHPGIYRMVSHSAAYIFREWGRYFEVVRIIPGFTDMQNLVVLRREGGKARL